MESLFLCYLHYIFGFLQKLRRNISFLKIIFHPSNSKYDTMTPLNQNNKQNEGGFKGNTRVQIFFFQKESRQREVK